MLEIRNITKIYRSKTGEEVRALDGVSIQFPERGMVFLLGKSGSGKSTLLNVIGGLDSYDSGEFVIKGKSSKDFVGSDFDAYRNTFIGFIFQEYNVLDEFSVGANIGLALELQGKKATSQAIEQILAQVDLVGYAHRKPNELSGGQKQRVAIARALVKDPQIIMADEPTGALDSNTGKQIFDTLKALSKEKLVLVVSHDRDFAERYADRIIELSDGRIIDDVTKHERESERISAGVHRINDNILRIESGYRLTAADLEMINAYLAKNQGDVLLSGDRRVNDELRSAVGISEHGTSTVFEGTVPERDVVTKEYAKEDSRFIRSRLPMRNAVKIGASGLKHKTVRLIFTIILSLVAFTLFGLADTLSCYDKFVAATDSMLLANQNGASTQTAALSLNLRRTTYSGGKERVYYDVPDTFNDEDIATLEERTGLDFLPVYKGSTSSGSAASFSSYLLDQGKGNHMAYTGSFAGFTTLTEQELSKYGLRLVSGMMPTADGQIVITKHIYDQFKYYGYAGSDGNNVTADKLTEGTLIDASTDITSAEFLESCRNSILFKKLRLRIGNSEMVFTIVGVVDTAFPTDRFASMLPSTGEGGGEDTQSNLAMETMLAKELETALFYSFHCLGFVTAHDVEILSAGFQPSWRSTGLSLNGMSLEPHIAGNDNSIHYIGTVMGNDYLPNAKEIQWLDTPRTALAENEIIVSAEFISHLFSYSNASLNTKSLAEAIKQTTSFGQYFQTDAEYLQDAIDQAISEYCTKTYGDYANWPNTDELRAEVLPCVIDFLGLDLDLTDFDAKERYELLGSCFGYVSSSQIEEYSYCRARLELMVFYEITDDTMSENEAFRNAMRAYYEREFGPFPESTDEHLLRYREAYRRYLENEYEGGYQSNPWGAYSGRQLLRMPISEMLRVCGITMAQLQEGLVFRALTRTWDNNGQEQTNTYKTYTDWKIVGVHSENDSGVIYSDAFAKEYKTYAIENDFWLEETAPHKGGIYSLLMAPMPQDREGIETLVQLNYGAAGGDVAFALQHQVIDTLEMFNGFAEPATPIFLWVGVGFAVFAALLLMNFIATSIAYKKREIGILRAVGARSSDVFKIFFSEATIIALINFVLSAAAVFATIFFLNNWMVSEGMNIALLHLGVRQIVLMLGVSIAVALLSSFFPVWGIARKKPVDAIKDR